MKIYITRHGQTQWNIEDRIQGSQNSNLTEQGKQDALNLGDKLRYTKIDYIYTSPLKRTYNTALLIKRNRDIPI
ncbi:phosphoglycerate mutase family protein [[Clostridium] sordellii]|nr:phosphoglycerate mutase family protein [[Clostridium] sordellii] [Paeniclostridium sordellii]